jgi:hypothetical protein
MVKARATAWALEGDFNPTKDNNRMAASIAFDLLKSPWLILEESWMTSGRGRGHQTQWAAQFAVASELCKRGYEVSFTMGNATPVADLLVVSPRRRRMFLIDVKGLYRRNPWLIKRKPAQSNLYYVFAFVPDEEPNQFFVMNQRQANTIVSEELTRLRRPDTYSVTGIGWQLALPHKDRWDILPK